MPISSSWAFLTLINTLCPFSNSLCPYSDKNRFSNINLVGWTDYSD